MKWSPDKVAAFDFETSGTKPEYALQPWRLDQGKFWPTSLVWVHETPAKYVHKGGLFPTVDDMERMLRWAIKEDRTLVGWNLVYDISVLLAHGLDDLVNQCRFLDGMLLWKHATIEPEYEAKNIRSRKSYGLKAYVAEYHSYDAGYEEGINYHSVDPADLKKLHRYNIKDNIYTLLGAQQWWEVLTPRQQRVALFEAESLPVVAKSNLMGRLIDTPQVHDQIFKMDAVAKDMLGKLAPYGVTEKVVRSPQQLAHLMFDEWKLPVLIMNKENAKGVQTRSTNKEVLHELSFKDARANQLRAYREALNLKTKFSQAILKSVAYNEDGHSHPELKIFGTYTGRMTVSSKQGYGKDAVQTGFAEHQMKNDRDFRAQIIVPVGYDLVEFDAAGQEFRWMACASGDQTMLQLCLPGEDAHSFMGARISHLDYRFIADNQESVDPDVKKKVGVARKSGKVGNLSLQYRTSARKLRSVARVQYDMDMSMAEAQQGWKTYQQTYTGVPKYWTAQIQLTKQRGYVETLAGRRVQVVGDWSGPNGWSMGSTSINYRIQGTGGDQKYLAMMLLKDYVASIGGYFMLDMHDGLYYVIPKHMTAKAVVVMRNILLNLPYKQAWGYQPPIALPWDCKVGPSWGGLKGWKFQE